MKNLKVFATVLPLLVAGVTLTPQLRADNWDKLTKVTFSAPFEVPGHVLPAGTYYFKLLDAQTNRNIVQIYNSTNTRQVAMVMAIPDMRAKPAGHTVITFEERASDAPPAIKAWFFPGDVYGQEFVYPKVRAMALAKRVNAPVPSMPEDLSAQTQVPAASANSGATAMRNAQVNEEEPSGNEVAIAEEVTIPPQLAQNNPPAASAPAPAPAATLPKTASDLPLFALVGLFLTGAGSLVRFGAKRLS